jgi:hypothetical protein
LPAEFVGQFVWTPWSMCKCERDHLLDLPEGGGGGGDDSDGDDSDGSNAAMIQVELTPSTKSAGWSYTPLQVSSSDTC